MDAGTISLLEPYWARMRAAMESSLLTDVRLLSDTNDALLANSGKLLRPALSLLIAGACGKLDDDSVKIAAASELLHNATLLHDDVTDESMQRRGRPTVLSLFGPSSAVLIGDFWLAKSVNILLSLTSANSVFSLFSKTLSDLAEGEMLQLEKSASADTDIEAYFRIIYCKTASLFETAAAASAVLTGVDDKTVGAAREYAKALGIAFQIKDDILDYCGGQELGKPTGVDIKEGKITLPLLLSFEGSSREAEMRALVRTVGKDASNVDRIRAFVEERGGIGKAAEMLSGFVDKSVKALETFPESPYRDALERIARYNEFRKI